MKIFLASASFDDVRWASSCGFLDGVLVSPSLLDGEASGAPARALELARLFACPVILSLGSRDAEELYREGRELSREADEVILEFPLAADTVEGMHRATGDGVNVAASMVFTSAQALLAARAGAAAVLVHINALESQGQNASATFTEMRRIFDAHRLECELFAVGPTSAGQVALCAAAGVDAVIVDASVLRDLLLHPLADRTFDALLSSTPAPSRARTV
jgi:transaldolase